VENGFRTEFLAAQKQSENCTRRRYRPEYERPPISATPACPGSRMSRFCRPRWGRRPYAPSAQQPDCWGKGWHCGGRIANTRRPQFDQSEPRGRGWRRAWRGAAVSHSTFLRKSDVINSGAFIVATTVCRIGTFCCPGRPVLPIGDARIRGRYAPGAIRSDCSGAAGIGYGDPFSPHDGSVVQGILTPTGFRANGY